MYNQKQNGEDNTKINDKKKVRKEQKQSHQLILNLWAKPNSRGRRKWDPTQQIVLCVCVCEREREREREERKLVFYVHGMAKGK